MSDDFVCQLNWPTKICCLSCKIARFCRLIKSPDFIVELEHVPFSTIKLANFLDIGHHSDSLQWEMNIYFTYLFCLLLGDAVIH